MNFLLLTAWIVMGFHSIHAFAETKRRVVDEGYEFSDGGKKIKSTERDGFPTEIVFTNSNISTPCVGKNLPSDKTRNARVQSSLSCSGGVTIDEVRRSENFEKISGFTETLKSGDDWALFEFMREHSKTSWKYKAPYTTNVKWTWTRHLKGKNGQHCGYRYEPTTCTKKIEIRTRSCWYVPDPEPSSGGGFSPGGGGFSPGGGGFSPGGGSYEKTNPFGFNEHIFESIMDLVIPKAYAGEECSSWSTDYDYDSFTCYNRYVQSCEWTEEASETMLCSNESMAVQLDLVKKSDAIWNPDQPNYVPFIPNGNDLLPGEAERMRLQVQISGSHVNYSEPIISGGENGSESSYYSYDHEIINNSFNCAQNAQNKFQWKAHSKDRQVSKTPNSLLLWALKDGHVKNFTQKDLATTGLYNSSGENILGISGSSLVATSLPEIIRMLDTSSQRLSIITSAFRQSDDQSGEVNNRMGETVVRGQSAASGNQKFWKDTFYRVQLYEVFPHRSKKPIRVTEMLVQTDSLVHREGDLITIPLAGQRSDTESAYDLSSSGVIIPKKFFRVTGEDYVFIPNQDYELRLSMLHRGIPFYHSGCTGGVTSCEREEPNIEAFSDEIAVAFKYAGSDERGFLRKYYDFMRRVSPW